MPLRLNSSNNSKQTALKHSPHNNIDLIKLDKDSINAVHTKHICHKKYANFAPLYQSKTRFFNILQTFDSYWKSKFIALHCALSTNHLMYLLFTKSVAAKAVEEELQEKLNDYSEEEEDWRWQWIWRRKKPCQRLLLLQRRRQLLRRHQPKRIFLTACLAWKFQRLRNSQWFSSACTSCCNTMKALIRWSRWNCSCQLSHKVFFSWFCWCP